MANDAKSLSVCRKWSIFVAILLVNIGLMLNIR